MTVSNLVAEIARCVAAAAGQVAAHGRLVIAYSGGIDSHVLLHALARARDAIPMSLEAVHVDHRLQDGSAAWAEHCLRACQALQVPCECIVIAAHCPAGRSREAWAREARYAALREHISAGDMVVTAHHRNDQAETFLLNALRGAGPAGLAAIPAVRRLGSGWLVRPMLDLDRQAIVDYARVAELHWIDDRSNADTRFDRNFIRHVLMPVIEARWPHAARTLARTVGLQQQAATVLDAAADRILASAHHTRPVRLPLSALDGLNATMRGLVLRRWLKAAGYPIPEQAQLAAIETGVLAARADAQACARWKGAELRRYRDHLYVMHELAPPPLNFVTVWNPRVPLELAWGQLTATRVTGAGLREEAVARAAVTVCLRRGGERCTPAGRHHSQTLKRLFQAWGVPPWERDRTPLVHLDGELGAVGSHCICAPFVAGAEEPAWKFDWRPQT